MQTAESRYRPALELYRTTNLPVKEICRQTNIGEGAFRAYVRRCHRELMFARHGISTSPEEAISKRLTKPSGQRASTRVKYKEAILACDDCAYLEYTVSEIAHMFHLSPTGLGNQLRVHFPEILERREKERSRQGINDNRHRGERAESKFQYNEAISHLKGSTDTIKRTAELYNVPYAGLREYIIRYHKNLVKNREERRKNGKGNRERGMLSGNGQLFEPSSEQNEKYEEAVKLYKTTALTQKEIARETGVSLSGLKNYLRMWHRDLILERRGYLANTSGQITSLSETKHYLKSTATKYASAIQRLKETGKPTAEIAKEFGLHPESFRNYIHEHDSALAAKQGMTTGDNGKRVLTRSVEKYAEAIQIYSSTTESLKSIAKSLNISYKSLNSFIHRNRQDAIEAHNNLISSNT